MIFKEVCFLFTIYLKHSHKVNIVSVNHLVNESDELIDKTLVLLEPRSVEVKTEGSPVGLEMAVEVVTEKPGELLRGLDVGTR